MDSSQIKLSEQDINEFTDALNNCCFRLSENCLYNHDRKSEIISHRSVFFSQEMYDCMLIIIGRMSTSQIQYAPRNTLQLTRKNDTVSTNGKDKSPDFNHNNFSNCGEVMNVVGDVDDETELPEQNFFIIENQNDPLENEMKIDIQDEPIVNGENNQVWQCISTEESAQDEGAVTSSSQESPVNTLDGPMTRIVISNVNEIQNNIDTIPTDSVNISSTNSPEVSQENTSQPAVKQKSSRPLSLKQKTRIIRLALANPDWTIEQLKKQSGCTQVLHKQQLTSWMKHVKSGGSYSDKIRKIDNFVMRRCIEYRKKHKEIPILTIQQWGKQAKQISLSRRSSRNFFFAASTSWAQKIKLRFDNITERSLAQEIRQHKIEVESEPEEYEDPQYPEDEIGQENVSENSQIIQEEQETPVVKRKRGRPRKKFLPTLEKSVPTPENVDVVVKRKRGRPRKSLGSISPNKHPDPVQTVTNCTEKPNPPSVKRKVGRPRKHPLPLQENFSLNESQESPQDSLEINLINRWVYDQCIEYQKNNKYFSKKLVSEWFNEAQKACLPPHSHRIRKFSHSWFDNFKKIYGIIGSPCTLRINNSSSTHVQPQNVIVPSPQPVEQSDPVENIEYNTINDDDEPPPQPVTEQNDLQQYISVEELIFTTQVPSTSFDTQNNDEVQQHPQPVVENETLNENLNENVEEIGETVLDTRLRITDVLSLFASGLVTLQPAPKQENILVDIE